MDFDIVGLGIRQMAKSKESAIVVPYIATRRHHIFCSASIWPLRTDPDIPDHEYGERSGPHAASEVVSVSTREPPPCLR